MIGFSEIILAIFVALFINKKEDWKFYCKKFSIFKKEAMKYKDNFIKELNINNQDDVIKKNIKGEDGKQYISYSLDFIADKIKKK